MKKNKNIRITDNDIITLIIIIVLVVSAIIFISVIETNLEYEEKYDYANSLMDDKMYELAIDAYNELGNYKDSKKFMHIAQQKMYIDYDNTCNCNQLEGECNNE